MNEFYWMADDLDEQETNFALEAAENMAQRFKTDMVILWDLSVKFADEWHGNYLELIRYQECDPRNSEASRGV